MMRFTLLFFSIIFFSTTSYSQNYIKGNTQSYLRRTAFMINQTHKGIIKLDSLNRDGKFAKAIAHQRMARSYYQANDFKNAIYHSYYARRLTNIVASTYNPAKRTGFSDTAEEMKLVMGTPTDKKLEEDLLKSNPGIKFNDADYIGDNKLYKLDVDDLMQP